MERNQLRETLEKGKPLASQYDQFKKSINTNSTLSFILGGIIVVLIATAVFWIWRYGFAVFTTMLIKDFSGFLMSSLFVAVFLGVLLIIPIINFIPMGIAAIIGSIFFARHIEKLETAANQTLEEFLQTTNFPETYCKAEMINKFIEYMDTYRADTLKECANLYYQETQQKEILEQVNKVQKSVDSVGNEIENLTEAVNRTQYK
jgi:hypothetical protein